MCCSIGQVMHMRCRVAKVRLGYEHVLQVRLGRPRSIKRQKIQTFLFICCRYLDDFSKIPAIQLFLYDCSSPFEQLSKLYFRAATIQVVESLQFLLVVQKGLLLYAKLFTKKKFNYKNVFKFEKAPILTVIYVVLAHKIQWVPLNGILDNRIHLLMRSKFTSIVKSKTTLNT